jgi:hypothetical protein
MNRKAIPSIISSKRLALGWSLVLLPAFAAATAAQEQDKQQAPPPQPTYTPQDMPGEAEANDAPIRRPDSADLRVADGRRERGVPIETYAVTPGTKFLVRLENGVGTKGMEENQAFRVRTLEPLEAGSGIYLPAGAEIRGHVSRSEPAGVAGRARLWLTFDEIRTRFGKLPIVAEVISVPGDHSVKAFSEQGLIEGHSSTQHDAAQSAAAGAAIGAIDGVKHKDKKAAAEGAALGALTAYLMESGRGHELNLPKGAKLELELERALYLLKE